MSDRFPELDRARVSVDQQTRQRHLAAISSALQERSEGSGGHGRVLAVALVLVLLVPVMALAAENSVPGDFLYPIKRAVEPVVEVFDTGAPAEWRVREVEVLLERDAPDEVMVERVDIAREEISDAYPELSDRIEQVVHDMRERDSDGGAARDPDVKPGEERPTDDEEVVQVEEDDRGEGERVAPTTSTIVSETNDTNRQGDRGTGD